MSDDFEKYMDAAQTVYGLRAGDTLTDAQVADIRFFDEYNRDDEEKRTDIFHRGFHAGLERGGGADTAKLINELDVARSRELATNAISTMQQQRAFIDGVLACRETMARFVEQGGDDNTAASIRANWNPAWGNDPGAPEELPELPAINTREADPDREATLDQLAERFCRAPLPESVCADLCATEQGPGRSGTNLLSVAEAKEVLRHVVETAS